MCSRAPASDCLQPFLRCPPPFACPCPCPCPSPCPCPPPGPDAEKLRLFLFGSGTQLLLVTAAPIELIAAVGTHIDAWDPIGFSFTAPAAGTYLFSIQVDGSNFSTTFGDVVIVTTSVNAVVQPNLAAVGDMSTTTAGSPNREVFPSGSLILQKDDVVQFLAAQSGNNTGAVINFVRYTNLRVTNVSITQL